MLPLEPDPDPVLPLEPDPDSVLPVAGLIELETDPSDPVLEPDPALPVDPALAPDEPGLLVEDPMVKNIKLTVHLHMS